MYRGGVARQTASRCRGRPTAHRVCAVAGVLTLCFTGCLTSGVHSKAKYLEPSKRLISLYSGCQDFKQPCQSDLGSGVAAAGISPVLPAGQGIAKTPCGTARSGGAGRGQRQGACADSTPACITKDQAPKPDRGERAAGAAESP